MNMCSRVLTLLAVCLLVGVTVQSASATRISGKSSTEFEWYDNADEDTATPVYQYLLFNALDIGDSGWSFRGYGRLADDLSDEDDVDSELYYAYLEKRDLIANLDLMLGRQFIVTAAGASTMDGVHLDYRNLGPLDLRVYGGGDVKFDDNYGSGDWVLGGEVTSDRLIDNLVGGLSYIQKRDEDDLAYELFGLDLDYAIPGVASFYNETQYSWLTKEVTYFILGSNFQANDKLGFRTEYLYSLPVFSSTSIYSVFAVEEYQELLFEANYELMPGITTFGRITHEFYEDVNDADVFEVGLEKMRTDKLSGYLVGTLRDDEDGQDMKGVKARVAYLFTPRIEAGIGAHIDVLERQIGFLDDVYNDDDDTTSQRYWTDANVYLTKKISVQGKVEMVKSDLWDEYFRGRMRLVVLF